MGFESFRVELRGGSTTHSETKEIIQKFPHAKPDEQSPPMKGSAYYILGDERHIIEVEIRDVPVSVSCRFTLCHPPTVDAVFLGLLRELMLRLGMEARIREGVRPEHAHSFSFADFAEFAAVTSHYIAARRTEWMAVFGSEQLAATTNEVHQRIILPRCQPVHAQPIF